MHRSIAMLEPKRRDRTRWTNSSLRRNLKPVRQGAELESTRASTPSDPEKMTHSERNRSSYYSCKQLAAGGAQNSLA